MIGPSRLRQRVLASRRVQADRAARPSDLRMRHHRVAKLRSLMTPEQRAEEQERLAAQIAAILADRNVRVPPVSTAMDSAITGDLTVITDEFAADDLSDYDDDLAELDVPVPDDPDEDGLEPA